MYLFGKSDAHWRAISFFKNITCQANEAIKYIIRKGLKDYDWEEFVV